ncbi:ECF transporter S component [Nesterenkonia sp.]|uniref:ECF transporter S component n=1 Tax=Nesterenkonia sp. TaxID=704201 RepID=UPI0026364642|nr:ECF transporter S component [Nesterenkonia sp.]
MSTSASLRTRWNVSDIVVASTLAVASGVIFWGWNLSYHAVSTLFVAYPPTASVVAGMWLFPAVLGALIIRKPGAAIYCEMVAAAVSALLGSQWGLGVLLSGFLQGLGAELILLAFLYRRFTLDVAVLAGAAAGLAGGINENWIASYYQYDAVGTVVHIAGFALSGAVIAGALPWLATRGLAATGVLGPLKSRRAHLESALTGRTRTAGTPAA